MKKILLIAASLLALPISIMAQNTDNKGDWKISGITGLNVSQTSLTNWAAGGENSLAGNIYLNVNANYKIGKFSWDNSLVTDFGQNYTKTLGWQTSVDKINLVSKAGYSISKHWSMSALADFLTQYTEGYKSAQDKNNGSAYISNIMAPGYLNLALGFDYKPNDDFSLLLSPVTGKLTFVLDKKLSENGAYGVKKGEKVFAQLGTSLIANYNKQIFEDLKFSTRLTLFTAYNHNFGNIDVNWDAMLAYKLNKFITATLTTNLIYDDDIKTIIPVSNGNPGGVEGPKVQFREILGVGFAYNF